MNEYINGLIRQYIPKGTSFENITPEYIQMIEDKLNNRPRKSLNWKTPDEVFYIEKIVVWGKNCVLGLNFGNRLKY